MIVPTLCVVTLLWTLCVRQSTPSVGGCIPTRSVGTISRAQARGAITTRQSCRPHGARSGCASGGRWRRVP
ncbi:MAG: hypothetical protein EOP13_17750 [Pseudomonas sp.]|nr:MAG: hypothetical protein EOP13_17750 [Pseudomonas sp.]